MADNGNGTGKRAWIRLDLGSGPWPIYYGVVFAWLLLATGSGAAVIISLFLGGEPPNLDIVKDVIAILGLPAGMIIAKLFDWKAPPGEG